MNHGIFIIKVIRNPTHLVYCEQDIIEAEVQFATPKQKNSRNEFKLILWGGHKEDFLRYYRVQDYLLIEGIIIITDNDTVKITVKRLYPFIIE
uniref:Ycf41 n=1 Tax=Ishige okamurae TaxID=233772 RepID=A0A8E5XRM2_9PHAE|nr:hypothetical protein Ycf41 [Ishige okamurae]QVJ99656.1 hypothetical protein Ycf41 [Ishige okamurae]WAM64092.1 hypothetical protein [Ishige okamurae]